MFCAAPNCLNNSKSKVNTFKFSANSKLRKQWLLKMKRKEFKPDKNSRICAVHFTEDCFRENLAIHRFLVLISSCSDSTSEKMLCRLVFLFGNEITGKNASRSTKVPLSVRLLLNEEVRGMHFAPFLLYLELHRVFVMTISTFTLLVWLVMIKY